MKFSAIVLLTLTVTIFGKEINPQAELNPPRIASIDSSENPGPAVQESGIPIQEAEFPQDESEGPNHLIPGGIEDEQQQIITGEGEGGNVERPKRFFWPVFRNNHYYYSGRSYDNHHHHYRRYCRHYHTHCYRSPYYHCENICDNWGYYYY